MRRIGREKGKRKLHSSPILCYLPLRSLGFRPRSIEREGREREGGKKRAFRFLSTLLAPFNLTGSTSQKSPSSFKSLEELGEKGGGGEKVKKKRDLPSPSLIFIPSMRSVFHLFETLRRLCEGEKGKGEGGGKEKGSTYSNST